MPAWSLCRLFSPFSGANTLLGLGKRTRVGQELWAAGKPQAKLFAVPIENRVKQRFLQDWSLAVETTRIRLALCFSVSWGVMLGERG